MRLVKCEIDKLTNYFLFDKKKGLWFNHTIFSYLCGNDFI